MTVSEKLSNIIFIYATVKSILYDKIILQRIAFVPQI